ncbi:hypothetical protein F2Q68_00015259 [Brassica cretica]|uniref:Uncharacterized protein n=1 Tax=Brassica cretica TaxID=69181 RepID=A0A8S9HSG4_BRACR|nr:hypothetical protein F2Q68_00015259 [Brassica cretica]
MALVGARPWERVALMSARPWERVALCSLQHIWRELQWAWRDPADELEIVA